MPSTLPAAPTIGSSGLLSAALQATPDPHVSLRIIEVTLLDIIDRKIRDELRTVDQKTASQVRDLWSTVTPAPSCPAASEVMKKINKICHTGLSERGKVLQETVITTLIDIEKTINKKTIEKILGIAKKHFPENQFVSLAENTKGIYQRGNAPAHKYSERSFELEITAIKCGSANISRQAIGKLKTALEEINLKKKLNKPTPISVFLKWCAIPALKWTFTVIGVVIAAITIYLLGING